MEETQSRHTPLRAILAEATTSLINSDAEAFDLVLLETLRRAAEAESIDMAAVLGGSIREGTVGWRAGGAGLLFDQLHEALFENEGARIAADGCLALNRAESMGAEIGRVADQLGVSSLLVTRIGDGDESEAAMVFGAAASRDWSAELQALVTLFAAAIAGLSRHERQEASRAVLEAEVQQSRNLEAISKLSGGIAHDINDMLVPIIGHSEAILEQGVDAVESGISAILRSAKGAADLTRQLLAFSQKQVLVKKPTDVAVCLGEMRDLLSRLMGEGVNLSERATETPWCVQADRGQLQQVILNLCANARDAMDGVGNVEISIENVTLGQGGRGYVNGDFVRLAVRDHGCGIKAEQRDQMFEPFYTTKGSNGTGLGLPVVQGIVEQHGGWIDFESSAGEGSTFSVFFPAERDVVVPARGASRKACDAVEGVRVLLVDDEPSVLAFVKQMLAIKGYDVTTAPSRDAAFEILNGAPDRFDLIFSDAMLSDGTGMDVIQHARALDPEIRALLSSGYSDDRSLMARAESEDIDFLAKPYSLEELTSAVGNVLGATLAS